MGALILRFLPLERTVVALKQCTNKIIDAPQCDRNLRKHTVDYPIIHDLNNQYCALITFLFLSHTHTHTHTYPCWISSFSLAAFLSSITGRNRKTSKNVIFKMSPCANTKNVPPWSTKPTVWYTYSLQPSSWVQRNRWGHRAPERTFSAHVNTLKNRQKKE